MIVSKNTLPDKDIYYVGALILDVLEETDTKDVDFFWVYGQIKSFYDLSISTFSLTLDWLFLLGAVDSNEGKITKCF